MYVWIEGNYSLLSLYYQSGKGFPGGSVVKILPAMGRRHEFDSWEYTLEKKMATHSSIHAWEIL